MDATTATKIARRSCLTSVKYDVMCYRGKIPFRPEAARAGERAHERRASLALALCCGARREQKPETSAAAAAAAIQATALSCPKSSVKRLAGCRCNMTGGAAASRSRPKSCPPGRDRSTQSISCSVSRCRRRGSLSDLRDHAVDQCSATAVSLLRF